MDKVIAAEIDVVELMRKVRDQSIGNQVVSSVNVEAANSQLLSVKEFFKYEGTDFVDNCYRRILGRVPDEAGMIYYLERLRANKMTKIQMIASIRFSIEGKQKKVVIKGLYLRLLFLWLCKIPLCGILLKRFILFIRQSKHININTTQNNKSVFVRDSDIQQDEFSLIKLKQTRLAARVERYMLEQSGINELLVEYGSKIEALEKQLAALHIKNPG